MHYFAEAAFASSQFSFQNHASEAWAHGAPEICDNFSTLSDPSVSFNEQGHEFQSRNQTGPEAAFLINEMFLHGRDALDNWFEAKGGLRCSPQELSTVSCFGSTFRQQEILRRTRPTFVIQSQLLGQGGIRVKVARKWSVRWPKMEGLTQLHTVGPGGESRVAIKTQKFQRGRGD